MITVKKEPDYWRYKGKSLAEAKAMFDEIEENDNTAARIVKFGDFYYTIYAD